MEERRRQTLLKAMGVDSFIPRVVLPAAAPSPICEIYFSPEELAQVQRMPRVAALESFTNNAQKNHAPTQPRSPGSKIDIQSLMGDVNEKSPTKTSAPSAIKQETSTATTAEPSVAPEGQAPSVETSAARANNAKAPRFQLSMTYFHGGVLAIDSTGSQAASGHQVFCQRLLKDIAFACGVTGADIVEAEIFSWPMIPGDHIDQSESVAKETLKASITGRRKRSGLTTVLLFGDLARYYVLGGDDSAPVKVGNDLLLPGTDIHVIATHGLQQLLQQPQLKRETWQHLQPLVARNK